MPGCLLVVHAVVVWNVLNKGDGAQSGALVDEAHNNNTKVKQQQQPHTVLHHHHNHTHCCLVHTHQHHVCACLFVCLMVQQQWMCVVHECAALTMAVVLCCVELGKHFIAPTRSAKKKHDNSKHDTQAPKDERSAVKLVIMAARCRHLFDSQREPKKLLPAGCTSSSSCERITDLHHQGQTKQSTIGARASDGNRNGRGKSEAGAGRQPWDGKGRR